MWKLDIALGALLLCTLTGPASAADYYTAAHYVSANGDGDAVLLVNANSVHSSAEGYKVAEFVAVNGGGTAMSVYAAQFDCTAKSWRVTEQNDYYTENGTAPVNQATRDLPAFSPVNDGSPVQGVLNMVCGWPATMVGAAKFAATDVLALNKAVSPTLKFTPPPG
jgi:hypothetical protein